MAKASKERHVPVQKGPVSVEDQYSYRFHKSSGDMTRSDMKNMADRRSGQTLTKHEPKR